MIKRIIKRIKGIEITNIPLLESSLHNCLIVSLILHDFWRIIFLLIGKSAIVLRIRMQKSEYLFKESFNHLWMEDNSPFSKKWVNSDLEVFRRVEIMYNWSAYPYS